jgi:TonB family protein
MNVQASELMSEVWAALEGRVVNGEFPLQRHLGGSDHSGVFLTECTKRKLSEVAVKLVPATPPHAEAHLSRWLTAADLDHPHVLRILEAGQCQLGGLRYLYAVMEYADQNLAQLLEHRAMTPDEAREMLAPTLSALAFLHDKKLVQGQLKPSNVLVVGDQIKLASDTIRAVGDATGRFNALSVYDPPEAQDGSCVTAGDVWALGVTLSEALIRRQLLGLHENTGRVLLPPDLPHVFRDVVARCLNRKAQDRPSVAEISAWLGGGHAKPAPAPAPAAAGPIASPQPVVAPPQPMVASPQPVVAPPQPVVVPPQRVTAPPVQQQYSQPAPAKSEAVAPSDTTAEPPARSRAIPLTLAIVALLALSWGGMRVLKTEPVPSEPPPVADTVREVPPQSAAPVEAPSEPAIAVPEPEVVTETSEIYEVLPEVPQRASQTIRGRVKVSVRVIVDKDGTVFAALADDPGPSRYFERLALDAAKKWTFAPADTEGQRLMLLHFEFTRDGATARADAVN